MNNIAIQLTNVTKTYTIHHEKPTLVEKFIKGRDETFIALNKINLTIKKGEKIGIIGPNGSGKTTLLKIISGITTHSSGQIITNGRVVSLIDVEAGFHPDISGYQNIFINGLLLGMKKGEIDNNLNKIISFANIRQFIDAPLFKYSEGMKMRLGFSIVIHSNPDILILDENVGLGDEVFYKKTRLKFREFAFAKKTIIMVSHWRQFIKQNCKRIIVMRNGAIDADGSVQLVDLYKKGNV